MKELIRQHFGIVVLAVAILLAVIIHAATTRYVAVSAGGDAYIVDHWTDRSERAS